MGFSNKLDAAAFRKYISEAETQLHGSQPLFVFDNHDNVRSIDRYGDGVHNQQIAKLLATVLLTTRATALMYYGEELGMTTSTPTRREDVKDPIGITGWPKEKGRDGERTPMQWDATAQAGFSTDAQTWLPIASNYVTVNVAAESGQKDSQLNWYQKLIRMRREVPALRDGEMRMLDAADAKVLAWERLPVGGGHAVVVVMNMSGTPQTVALDVQGKGKAATLLTDDPALHAAEDVKSLTLAPYASWIGSLP